MLRHTPVTLKLFPEDYIGKFEQACLHGAQQRITCVVLARKNVATSTAVPKLELATRLKNIQKHERVICQSWQDFPQVNSMHIDVLALQYLKLHHFEHFLSLLTYKGEKEVRLVVHQLGDEYFADDADAYVSRVLDRLTGPFFHIVALPIRYILRGPLKCTVCSMYHTHVGCRPDVIVALTAFLRRVQAAGRELRELCVPVLRLHSTQTGVATGLKNLLVAECVAMHNMFIHTFSGLHNANTKELQALFDSVLESTKVRTICFVANDSGMTHRTKDWTNIHAANIGRTFHCFAFHLFTSYKSGGDNSVHLRMQGCFNLRWAQWLFL